MIMLMALACIVWFAVQPSVIALLALLAVLYALPLLTYRVHNWFHPITPGLQRFENNTYSPWWGTHRIQLIYIFLPSLEAVLMMVPGLFSLWLRLWGSTIGKRVYWTPRLELLDRTLLNIGDDVVFGYNSGLCGHLVVSEAQFKSQKQLTLKDTVALPGGDKPVLLVDQVRVGRGVFVGAGSRLGPGTVVADKVSLPLLTYLVANQRVEK
jgi:acetyltransferase-like isoleucine patch superfamily enzyme